MVLTVAVGVWAPVDVVQGRVGAPDVEDSGGGLSVGGTTKGQCLISVLGDAVARAMDNAGVLSDTGRALTRLGERSGTLCQGIGGIAVLGYTYME